MTRDLCAAKGCDRLADNQLPFCQGHWQSLPDEIRYEFIGARSALRVSALPGTGMRFCSAVSSAKWFLAHLAETEDDGFVTVHPVCDAGGGNA